jgi:hypothetical protein
MPAFALRVVGEEVMFDPQWISEAAEQALMPARHC